MFSIKRTVEFNSVDQVKVKVLDEHGYISVATAYAVINSNSAGTTLTREFNQTWEVQFSRKDYLASELKLERFLHWH